MAGLHFRVCLGALLFICLAQANLRGKELKLFELLKKVVELEERQDSSSSDGTEACDTGCLEALVQEATSQIFNQDTVVPNLKKHKFRNVLTFGDRAFPILGCKDATTIAMAGAVYGQGRVFAMQSKAHLLGFDGQGTKKTFKRLAALKEFHSGLKSWLTQGAFTDNNNICWMDDESSMECLDNPEKLILVWRSGDWPSEEQTETVKQWIQDGGAFVHGFDYDTWSETSSNGQEGRALTSVGFYNILLDAGIAYDSNELSKCKRPMELEGDTTDASLLVQSNLKLAMEDLTFEKYESSVIIQYVKEKKASNYFPREVMQKLLGPLVPFAIAQESEVNWPVGSLDNRAKIAVPMSEKQSKLFSLYYALGKAGLWRSKAPNVELFPGDIPEEDRPETESGEVECHSIALYKGWCSTGYYLLPGQEMRMEVISTDDLSYTNFQVLIGSNTDRLWSKEDINRFPAITQTTKFIGPDSTTSSMFGGLITIYSPAGEGSYVKVRLSGVIKTPYFNLDDPETVANWNTRRMAPGLWADIRGRLFRFTLPSRSVRDLEDPSEMLTMWDSAIETNYDLVGKADKVRPQWLQTDIQISIGFMHSGFPIAGFLGKGVPGEKKYVFNGAYGIQWGIYHELGHNMPIGQWTWSGLGEVCNNVFALLQFERLGGHTDFPMGTMQKQINKNFVPWLQDESLSLLEAPVKTRLLPFYQIRHEFGWACLKKIYSSYRSDSADDYSIPESIRSSPKGDADELKQWVIRSSFYLGYNLCPLYDFWRFNAEDACDEVDALNLPPFLPDDVITQKSEAADIVASIEEKYNGLKRSVDVLPECPDFDLRLMSYDNGDEGSINEGDDEDEDDDIEHEDGGFIDAIGDDE